MVRVFLLTHPVRVGTKRMRDAFEECRDAKKGASDNFQPCYSNRCREDTCVTLRHFPVLAGASMAAPAARRSSRRAILRSREALVFDRRTSN